MIQANAPHFFHEELVQNQLIHGDFFPQAQQPWIQEAEIPTPAPTTWFQRPEMEVSYRRFMFSCQIEDLWYFLEGWVMFHFQQIRSKSQGEKKVISHGSALCQPQRCKSLSHISVHIKSTFLEQHAAKRGFPEGVTHTVCSTNRLSWEKITQRSTGFTPTLSDYKNETKRKKVLGRFGRAGIGQVKRKSAGGSSSSIPTMPEGAAGWIQHQRQAVMGPGHLGGWPRPCWSMPMGRDSAGLCTVPGGALAGDAGPAQPPHPSDPGVGRGQPWPQAGEEGRIRTPPGQPRRGKA